MAKPFSVETEDSRFRLPIETRKQILDLMREMDEDARTSVIVAVAERWQRECGVPERDVFVELDAIKAKLGMD